jgi:hypothetical protein
MADDWLDSRAPLHLAPDRRSDPASLAADPAPEFVDLQMYGASALF